MFEDRDDATILKDSRSHLGEMLRTANCDWGEMDKQIHIRGLCEWLREEVTNIKDPEISQALASELEETKQLLTKYL